MLLFAFALWSAKKQYVGQLISNLVIASSRYIYKAEYENDNMDIVHNVE